MHLSYSLAESFKTQKVEFLLDTLLAYEKEAVLVCVHGKVHVDVSMERKR